jgi:hypothetical protein
LDVRISNILAKCQGADLADEKGFFRQSWRPSGGHFDDDKRLSKPIHTAREALAASPLFPVARTSTDCAA